MNGTDGRLAKPVAHAYPEHHHRLIGLAQAVEGVTPPERWDILGVTFALAGRVDPARSGTDKTSAD